MKGRDRNRTRSGSEVDRRDHGREQAKYKYVSLVSERPHPLKRVPGIKRCYWDAEIGRWVQWRPDWRQD